MKLRPETVESYHGPKPQLAVEPDFKSTRKRKHSSFGATWMPFPQLQWTHKLSGSAHFRNTRQAAVSFSNHSIPSRSQVPTTPLTSFPTIRASRLPPTVTFSTPVMSQSSSSTALLFLTNRSYSLSRLSPSIAPPTTIPLISKKTLNCTVKPRYTGDM